MTITPVKIIATAYMDFLSFGSKIDESLMILRLALRAEAHTLRAFLRADRALLHAVRAEFLSNKSDSLHAVRAECPALNVKIIILVSIKKRASTHFLRSGRGKA